MEVRPWRTGDDKLLLAARFSAASLSSRFMAGTPGIPVAYLRHVSTVPRDRWDAQVAVVGSAAGPGARGPYRLLGWAEYGRWRAGGDEADIAVAVVDAWQRQGVATALLRAMLPRAAAAGVRVLHADIAPGNVAARSAAGSLFGRPTYADGLLHFRLALS
jgi:GNAT superfamily N-acetyltransferase